MSLLTLLITVLPGFLICYFIIKVDKYEKEPISLLAICWGLGAMVFYLARYCEGAFDDGVMPYINENDLNPNTHFGLLLFSAFVRTAFVEEFLKFVVLLLLPYNHKHFNEPMDGIVYAVMIGMGFAIIENVVYCMYPPDVVLAIVRNLTAVPSHAVFGVIMGYYVGLAKFNSDKRIQYLLLALFGTIFIHGLYDIFLFQEYHEWIMILATVVLLGGLFLSRKLIIRHQNDSPFKSLMIETNSDAVISNQPSNLKQDDNEILSAVLYEMKGKEEEE